MSTATAVTNGVSPRHQRQACTRDLDSSIPPSAHGRTAHTVQRSLPNDALMCVDGRHVLWQRRSIVATSNLADSLLHEGPASD